MKRKIASNEVQIRKLVKDWAKAAREQDMAGVLAHHANDIVMFDVPLPVRSKGIAAYKKTWDLFFSSNPDGGCAFDIVELNIAAGDAVGFCHALIQLDENTARLTMGLRKIRGKWLVTHEHHSYPLAS
jgi:ketosteroid isomerase-like protein